jgi:hypothetical protein
MAVITPGTGTNLTPPHVSKPLEHSHPHAHGWLKHSRDGEGSKRDNGEDHDARDF